MTISEAAKFLDCSEKSIRRYIRKGVLEGRKGKGHAGQAWDISESSLEDFKQKLQSGVVFPTIEKVDKAGQPGAALVKVSTCVHLDIPAPSRCPTSLPPGPALG